MPVSGAGGVQGGRESRRGLPGSDAPMGMDILLFVAFLGVWLLLQTWLLPRLGVGT